AEEESAPGARADRRRLLLGRQREREENETEKDPQLNVGRRRGSGKDEPARGRRECTPMPAKERHVKSLLGRERESRPRHDSDSVELFLVFARFAQLSYLAPRPAPPRSLLFLVRDALLTNRR